MKKNVLCCWVCVTLMVTRDHERLKTKWVRERAPCGSVDAIANHIMPDRLLFALPLPATLDAGKKCIKPTLCARVLDLLLSDW